MPFNDDAWMRTNHWDEKILRRVREIKTDVFLLDIPDTARILYANNFPCFPMVSRRAMSTLGFLLCPLVRMYPADMVTTQIYKHCNLVFPVRNVLIEHEHKMDYEGSKKALMDIFAEDMAEQKNLDLSEYVFKLMQVVASGLNKESKFKRILNIIRE
jgi:hypothetical protein